MTLSTQQQFSSSTPSVFAEASRLQLGQLLVAKGLITPDQLDEALEHQAVKGHKKLLGEVLVDLGICTEQQVLEVLAESYGIPFATQITRYADPMTISVLPREFIEDHNVLPLFLVKDLLTVAISEPTNVFVIEEIERLTGNKVQIVAVTADEIASCLKSYLPAANVFVIDDMYEDFDEADLTVIERQMAEVEDLAEVAGHSPVVKLVNYLIYTAVNDGASDIHIEPGDHQLRVRYRVDGRLFEKMMPPYQMQAALASRIKIMSNLDISERRVPQDGDIHIRIDGRPIDLRVATMPGKFGEKIVIRIIDNRASSVSLERLGMTSAMLETWKGVIRLPNGVVLVTGPTSSGKTTTLYSVLTQISSPEINISTVEDPVEGTFPGAGLNQFQVNEKAGFTFANALRAMLRQDPDVMMVGEIRDAETAAIVTQAALTGHLVFSTLHTNDAPSAVTRLVNIGIEPYLVAATLRAALAQRLVRKICPHCKSAYEPDAIIRQSVRAEFKKSASVGLAGAQLNAENSDSLSEDSELGTFTLMHGEGCVRCRGTGFAGRLGIFELLVPEDNELSLIASGASLQDLRAALNQRGFQTLRADGMTKVRDGLTTAEEVLYVTSM